LQHDVLFENLTVKEHIIFFSQLKGSSRNHAEQEATELTTRFHLEERLDHLGSELSGGQKRKLSVAIAVCGGSKFVVLDEPTVSRHARTHLSSSSLLLICDLGWHGSSGSSRTLGPAVVAQERSHNPTDHPLHGREYLSIRTIMRCCPS
jgi:predicted ABC-type transport system involved in lysophospholipase L1 biosynthesis ATPase subunit